MDVIAKAQKECNHAVRKVRWSHDLKDEVMPAHCDIFYGNADKHCGDMTTSQLKTWNNVSESVTRANIAHAKKARIQGTPSTQRWVQMLPTTREGKPD